MSLDQATEAVGKSVDVAGILIIVVGAVAASFPRDTLMARLAIAVANAYSRIRRIDFRAFVHSPEEILDTARRAGFEVVE